MAAGIRALRKILIGKENMNVPPYLRVPVDATAMLVGTANMSLEQGIFMPNEYETGRLASFERSSVIARDARLSFEADATYEQLMYFLEMGVKHTVHSNENYRDAYDLTRANDRNLSRVSYADNSVTTWVYAPNYVRSNIPRTFTMEYGDDVQAYQTAYCGIRQLELSGQVGDIVKISADMFGRDMVPLSPGGSRDRAGFSQHFRDRDRDATHDDDSVVVAKAALGTAGADNPNAGKVTEIIVESGGSGYTASDLIASDDDFNITLEAPPGGSTTTRATATAAFASTTTATYAITAGGAGYTSAPAVTVAVAGAGSVTTQPTATVSMGAVTRITGGVYSGLVSGTSTFTVSIAAPASGRATVDKSEISLSIDGSMLSIPLDNNGDGYDPANPPVVTIDPPTNAPTGITPVAATATALVSGVPLTTLTTTVTSGHGISSVGTGYTTEPAVVFSGGGGSGASARAVISNNDVSDNEPSGTVVRIVMLSGGAGYDKLPTITLVGGGVNSKDAAAKATVIHGSVIDIVVTNAGAGYANEPFNVFLPTPSGGTQAQGRATVIDGRVAYIVVTDPGSGYTNGILDIAGLAYSTTTLPSSTNTGLRNSPPYNPTASPPNRIPVEITPPQRETIIMGSAQLFMADSWEGLNSERAIEIPSTLVDFNYRIMTGFNPMRYADNRLTFTDIAEAKRHVEMDMTVAFHRNRTTPGSVNTSLNNSTADWFAQLYRTQIARVVELRFTGSSLDSNDNTGFSDNKTLRLRMRGKLTQFGELAEREGQDIVRIKFVSEMSNFDSAAGEAKDMEVILTNGIPELA